MQVDGGKFYIAESNIQDVINVLVNNNLVITDLKKSADSDTFKNEIIDICDDLLSVKSSLETLMQLVVVIKGRLMLLNNGSFKFDYFNQQILEKKEINESLDITINNGSYVTYNNYEFEKIIDDFVKTHPEMSYLGIKLENIGTWYIDNIPTYQASTSGKATGTRKKYQTPYGTRPFGDDCTEFTAAYMSYICGKDVPETYSGGMYDPNGTWAKEVDKLGWKAYSTDEIKNLKTGDILVAHEGAGYMSNGSYISSSKGEHAEVYINENETFGWGTIQKDYPLQRKIERKEINGHTHYVDDNHDYITVYRYEDNK